VGVKYPKERSFASFSPLLFVFLSRRKQRFLGHHLKGKKMAGPNSGS
jgi:hypothetical protein